MLVLDAVAQEDDATFEFAAWVAGLALAALFDAELCEVPEVHRSGSVAPFNFVV